jgi:hypothetical protein
MSFPPGRVSTGECFPLDAYGPLCPLLNDPELWDGVYPEKVRWDLFHVIRKGLLKSGKAGTVPERPEDDFLNSMDFMVMVTEQLGSPDVRKELEKKAKRTDLNRIPEALYHYSMEQWKELEGVGNYCVEKGAKAFASAETFPTFLEHFDEPEGDEEKKAFALCAAAFASLQPYEAKDILASIWEIYPEMEAWFKASDA